jgi:hypothetical protein
MIVHEGTNGKTALSVFTELGAEGRRVRLESVPPEEEATSTPAEEDERSKARKTRVRRLTNRVFNEVYGAANFGRLWREAPATDACMDYAGWKVHRRIRAEDAAQAERELIAILHEHGIGMKLAPEIEVAS